MDEHCRMTNLSTLSLRDLKQLETRIAHEIALRKSSTKKALLKRLEQMARAEGFTLESLLRGTMPTAKIINRAAKPKTALPIRYRHPLDSSLAWSGRGPQPQWMRTYLAHGGTLTALETVAEKFAGKQRKSLVG